MNKTDSLKDILLGCSSSIAVGEHLQVANMAPNPELEFIARLSIPIITGILVPIISNLLNSYINGRKPRQKKP